jgi:hypothetical protein
MNVFMCECLCSPFISVRSRPSLEGCGLTFQRHACKAMIVQKGPKMSILLLFTLVDSKACQRFSLVIMVGEYGDLRLVVGWDDLKSSAMVPLRFSFLDI